MSHEGLKDGDWKRKLELYPSLRKFEELGNDYVEWKDGREEALLNFILAHPDIESMRGNPNRILEVMDDFANNHDFLISVGVDKARILSGILDKTKPKVMIELGGYLGYSAILFGHRLLQIHGRNSGAQVWTVEPDAAFAKILGQLVSLAGLDDIVVALSGTADESLREFTRKSGHNKIDLLFIDHVEDLYEQDLKLAMDELKLLHTGSVIVADNVVRPGAPKYREFVRSRAGLESKGVRALIMPGEFEDELEVTTVL